MWQGEGEKLGDIANVEFRIGKAAAVSFIASAVDSILSVFALRRVRIERLEGSIFNYYEFDVTFFGKDRTELGRL